MKCNQWNMYLRAWALSILGGKCTCCGIDTFEFLTIDHIHGGGYKARLNEGEYSQTLCRKIVNMIDPSKDYQVLCWNCNCVKRNDRQCPHKVMNEQHI